jgi:hypothetical protein
MLNRSIFFSWAIVIAACPGPEPMQDDGPNTGGGDDSVGGNPTTTGPTNGGAGAMGGMNAGGEGAKGGNGGMNAGGAGGDLTTTVGAGGVGGAGECDPTNPPMDDILNCGACGRPCEDVDVADLQCVDGVCTSTCLPGFANVDAPPGKDVNGALVMDDGCELRAGRVFVTKDPVAVDGLGSATAADELCTGLADLELELEGSTWIAWVSEGTILDAVSPLERLGFPSLFDPVAYVLVRMDSTLPDTLVVSDAFDLELTNMASLDHAIDVDQTGAMIGGGSKPVWTGMRADGTAGPNCEGWSVAESGAVLGDANRVDARWTEDLQLSSPMACGGDARLYCFETPLAP